jgi:uncharacterized protein (TIGR03067 family)
MRVPIGTLLAIIVLIAAAGAGEDAAKKEWKKFNGTWIAIGLEKDGEKLAEEQIKSLKLQLILKDDKYTVKMDDKVIDSGTSKPDPTTKPKTIDVMPSEGPNKGKMIKGIYELDGDTLRVCYDLEGKGRPKAFATKADSGQVLIVYKRAKE